MTEMKITTSHKPSAAKHKKGQNTTVRRRPGGGGEATFKNMYIMKIIVGLQTNQAFDKKLFIFLIEPVT